MRVFGLITALNVPATSGIKLAAQSARTSANLAIRSSSVLLQQVATQQQSGSRTRTITPVVLGTIRPFQGRSSLWQSIGRGQFRQRPVGGRVRERSARWSQIQSQGTYILEASC